MSHLLRGSATAHGERLHQHQQHQQHHTAHQLNNTNPPNVTTEARVREMEDRSKVKRQLTTPTRSIKTRLHRIGQRCLGSYSHISVMFVRPRLWKMLRCCHFSHLSSLFLAPVVADLRFDTHTVQVPLKTRVCAQTDEEQTCTNKERDDNLVGTSKAHRGPGGPKRRLPEPSVPQRDTWLGGLYSGPQEPPLVSYC